MASEHNKSDNPTKTMIDALRAVADTLPKMDVLSPVGIAVNAFPRLLAVAEAAETYRLANRADARARAALFSAVEDIRD